MCDADAEIGLVELVAYVPAERSELSTFLYNRVEETQREQQLLEHLRLFVALEPLRVVDRIALIRSGDVRAETYIETITVHSRDDSFVFHDSFVSFGDTLLLSI